jgi:hypothetical protein
VARTRFLLASIAPTGHLTSVGKEDMNADHLYSHHDDGGDQDDEGENDEGVNVEELMRNIAPDVLLQCRNKGFETLEKCRETFFTRSVKGAKRSTRCCG